MCNDFKYSLVPFLLLVCEMFTVIIPMSSYQARKKKEDGRRCLNLFLERLKPRRWVFVPTRPCDAKATNSLCTLTKQLYPSIEYVFQQAGIFTKCYDGGYSKIPATNSTLDEIILRKRKRILWRLQTVGGLDGRDIQALFVIRGAPRTTDLVPCIVPPVDDLSELSSPMPNIQLSIETQQKLNEYWQMINLQSAKK